MLTKPSSGDDDVLMPATMMTSVYYNVTSMFLCKLETNYFFEDQTSVPCYFSWFQLQQFLFYKENSKWKGVKVPENDIENNSFQFSFWWRNNHITRFGERIFNEFFHYLNADEWLPQKAWSLHSPHQNSPYCRLRPDKIRKFSWDITF